MPICEYVCMECGKVYEEIRSDGEKDKNLICPSCHSTLIDRIPPLPEKNKDGGGDSCQIPLSGHT